MGSLPTLTVLEESHIAPPPATVNNRSLPLNFFDFLWLAFPPVNTLFFFEQPISKTQFTETIIPNLKNSLSITLQNFFPFVGNLIVYPSLPTKKPEIRYVEGDSVTVTFAECNLDFIDLTGNHPRDCDKFYHLIPVLRRTTEATDFIAIPVFSVQVTLFPGSGFSIGMTNHHSLGDASTRFCFLKAWASISQSGTDELFLTNGTLPFYDRVIQYPKLDESYLRNAKVETFKEDYQPPTLSACGKVRGTFILTRSFLNQLKSLVSTEVPTIPYVSSFTVACAYVWNCTAESRNDGLELFGFSIDCRARLKPAVPSAYFGNCVTFAWAVEKTALLTGKEGFITAAKLLGENLHKTLNDKDGVVKDFGSFDNLFSEAIPTTFIGVAGAPKLKFYDLDFAWGKPKKHETISIDKDESISMSACKESNEDLEIGVSLSATEMEAFVRIFNHGLETYLE